MNIRVGTDLVEIERFKRKLASSPSILKNLFASAELQNKEPAHLAGIFAAKEAAIKALDLSAGSWLEMEVNFQKNGRPVIIFSKNIRDKLESFDLSIAHEGNYAVAIFMAFIK